MSADERERGEGEQQTNWFQRLKIRLLGGDRISAEIGENASGVAVGKNIVQIGQLVIPTIPSLIFVLLLAGAAIYLLFFRPRGPKEMTGEFNIAVAQFGQIGADGAVERSADGARLSQWLFERLQTEAENLSQEINVQIWHDSLDLGVRLGVISCDENDGRCKEAEDLAEAIGADMVIYGNLDAGQDLASFTPKFYVAELPEAREIVGEHRLGTPINVRFPLDDLSARLSVNQKLSARAAALTYFTVGLAWESAGDPEKALEFFHQAEAVEGWDPDEGKEIVYLFIGREAFILWERGADRETEARQAFEEALALNPSYARAHIGLGNVYGELAERLLSARQDNLQEVHANVDQAIAEYQLARENIDETDTVHVRASSAMALSGAYRLKANAYLVQGDSAETERYLNLAEETVAAVFDIVGEDDHRYLVQAYLSLGGIYQLQAHQQLVQDNRAESQALFEKAEEAYTQCAAQAEAQPLDWFIDEVTNQYCLPYRENVREALAGLE